MEMVEETVTAQARRQGSTVSCYGIGGQRGHFHIFYKHKLVLYIVKSNWDVCITTGLAQAHC